MDIISAEVVTGTKRKSLQIDWFETNGYRYAINAKGKVFTTDDWMNLKDKGFAMNDDSEFDLSVFKHAS